MTRIIKRVEAHYEAHEVPFGCTYEWHPAYTALECDCGEKLVLTGMSTITTCGCGADHSAFIRDIREREGRLRDEVTHPWLHNTQDRAEQHLRDDATYPKDSPWRYNDITSDNTNNE
jgi:hypothetical protein